MFKPLSVLLTVVLLGAPLWPAKAQTAFSPAITEAPANLAYWSDLQPLQEQVLARWQKVQAAGLPQASDSELKKLLQETGQALQQSPADSVLLKKTAQQLLELQIRLMPSRTVELRGALINMDLIPPEPEALRKRIKQLKEAGFNALFPEVLRRGFSLYPNRLTEQEPQYARKGVDPLRHFVNIAREENMLVIPWFWVFRILSPDLSIRNPILEHLPALRAEPLDGKGYTSSDENVENETRAFISPASDEWRQLLIGTMMDLTSRYPVQGLFLDYIRYGNNQTEDQLSQTRFQLDYFRKVGQFPPAKIDPLSDLQGEWHLWREEQVNRLVKELRLQMAEKAPQMAMGAAVFRNEVNARNTKMQNWRHWSNNNWLDFVSPMMYARTPEELDLWLDWESDWGQRADLLYPILGAHQTQRKTSELFNQLGLLQQRNIPGVSIFAVRNLSDEVLRLLKLGPFRNPAMAPHINLPGAIRQQLSDLRAWLMLPGDPEKGLAPGPRHARLQGMVYSLAAMVQSLDGASFRNGKVKSAQITAWVQQLQTELDNQAENLPAGMREEIAFRLGYAAQLSRVYAAHEPSGLKYRPPSSPPSTVLPEARALPSVVIPALSAPPELNGLLDDPVWNQARLLSPLFWNNGAARGAVATDIKLGYDAQNLYLAFRNQEPRMDRLRSNVRVDGSDRIVGEDDTIEVFLSTGPDSQKYAYFVVNAINTRFQKTSWDSAWKGAWQSATRKTDSAWFVEMAIPWLSLGSNAAPVGNLRYGNFCRRRQQEIVPYHCWSFTFGGVHRPDRFGSLKLEPQVQPSPMPSVSPQP
jgi:uncharacterized lipoprotein YddW (UPF0748 family)